MIVPFAVKRPENILIMEEKVAQVAVPFFAVPFKAVPMNVLFANTAKGNATSIPNHGKVVNFADFKSVYKVV